jgi:ribosome-associated toxin RatA of RatAB toxin-antitoxin module
VPEVRSEITIDAPPQRVYALAKDIEGLPAFLPNVESVTIRERTEDRAVTEWVGLVPEFKRAIRWTEEDIWDDGSMQCQFHLLSGDWDRYEGTWTFEPAGDGTRVQLVISYEYNVPLIGPLIKKLLQKLVARNADDTLAGLRRRAAGDQ